MRKYVAALSLFAIAFSSVFFLPSRALACEEPPMPLRGMYLESDIIIVGKIGRPGQWIAGPVNEEMSQYRIFTRSFPITVEKAIKGDVPSKLSVQEDNYHYLGDGKTENVKATPEPDVESELAKDTGRRLFFLKEGENGNFTEIYSNRYNFAPKGKDLDTYIDRLSELNAMYKDGEPSKAAIVEWLVSMAENPVTRFEGAYELRESFFSAKYETEEAERAAVEESEAESAEVAEAEGAESADGASLVREETAEIEKTPSPEGAEVPEGEVPEGEGDEHTVSSTYGEAELARVLTTEQKERLIRAFMTVKFNYEPKKVEGAEDPDETYVEVLNEADGNLVDAVAMMGDSRVTNRLLAEIPKAASTENYRVTSWLELIAGQMKNDTLKALVQKYSEVAYGTEDELIETKESAYDLEEFPGSDEEKAEYISSLPFKTYGERRAELLDKILGSMNQLMAKK